jgi:LCP family protein required for cell wall assembly
LIFLSLTSLAFLRVYFWRSAPASPTTENPVVPGAAVVSRPKSASVAPISPVTIACFGLDTDTVREAQHMGRRSDTIVVIRVDPRFTPPRISVLNIPRDTYVEIPGRGMDKINHAYAFGGPDLAMKTVSVFVGAPIDYYVAFDMDFARYFFDLIGGVDYNVDINLPEAGLKPGMMHLNSDQALAYLRWRYDPMGDIGRVRRQQAFLKYMAQQFLLPKNIIRLPSLLQSIMERVVTNVTVQDMPRLLAWAAEAEYENMNWYRIPGEFMNLNGISYWRPLPDPVGQVLAQMFPVVEEEQQYHHGIQ